MADLQPRLKAQYDSVIRPKLTEQFGYTNRRVPTLDKVVVNMGIGEAVNDRKKVEMRRPISRSSPARRRLSSRASRSPPTNCVSQATAVTPQNAHAVPNGITIAAAGAHFRQLLF
jgi:hypothetical protein